MNTRKYGYYKPVKPNSSHYPQWRKKSKPRERKRKKGEADELEKRSNGQAATV